MSENPVATEKTPPSSTLWKMVIDGVSKSFASTDQKETIAALEPVSLDINEGEFVVFVGPSGCGKSTLLNIIAGFIQATSGKVLLNDREVTRPGRDRLMMFQEHGLFPWLNVIDNIGYGLGRNWFRRRARREKARAFLSMVHLDKFEKSRIHELSGGMKQRVALARALAPDPKVLLIDEPFPALDAMTRMKLYSEIQEIHVVTKKTIVFVTHEMREAACLGDRVFIFSGRPGRIMQEIRIDLPRPRDFNDPKVNELAAQILAKLEQNSGQEEADGKSS